MSNKIEISKILENINANLGINLAEVVNDGHRPIVDARRIYSSLAKKYTRLSLSKIGKEISRNHSTVIHYNKTCTDLREVNRPFNLKFIKCEANLL